MIAVNLGEGARELVEADTAAENGDVPTRRALERVPAQRLFAFTWQDDNGPDAFYGL